MRHYSDEWLLEWCAENGWTDLYQERPDHYWAFPPGAVMPQPIPNSVLYDIKNTKGWCAQERFLVGLGWAIAALSVLMIGLMRSPFPLVLVFVDGAIVSALLEVEY